MQLSDSPCVLDEAIIRLKFSSSQAPDLPVDACASVLEERARIVETVLSEPIRTMRELEALLEVIRLELDDEDSTIHALVELASGFVRAQTL